ncbi:MAG: hypothetical protein Q8S54_02645 [Bacteroidota bacterium]|nr:hypothetical protein [Odoribacter sp.]MDP3642071.1 hypothetical protein [Bacteroidota bacterium]
MNQTTQPDTAQTRSIISAKFIEPGFEYWFTNHQHIRSPFPYAIKDTVRERTSEIFFEWISGLKVKELNEMNENEFVEMFETILFNEAYKLVDDEDQQLTISYPFMPRLGDFVNHKVNGQGKVISRKATISKEDKKLFELKVMSQETGKTWETQFELTE